MAATKILKIILDTTNPQNSSQGNTWNEHKSKIIDLKKKVRFNE